MRILAIETSCDETGIALLAINGSLEKPKIKILGHSLFSQAKLHEEYGGVYPTLAKREHEKNLPILLNKTLEEAGVSPNKAIDYIAVTQGPGLEPALWAGITFARELGKKWSIPVLPINHMAGHVWSVLYGGSSLEFPAIALLVSGGHTELVKIDNFGRYQMLGETQDDAAGEAFDKVARMIGLKYPGGPKISILAKEARNKGLIQSISLPRPMLQSKNLNFSFSGLKTAVLYKLKEFKELDDDLKRNIAREFEDSVIEVLVGKTRRAIEMFPQTKTLIVAGGVSANQYLKEEMLKMLSNYPEIAAKFPSQDLSTDNAVMIGIAAFVKISTSSLTRVEEFRAEGNLPIA